MPLAGLTARRGTGTLGFHPSDVDKEAARRQVAKMVEGMAPDAVDEATGDRLDNLVNTWEDQWLTGVQQEYASYREQAGKLAGEEAAILAQLDPIRAGDRDELAKAKARLDEAGHGDPSGGARGLSGYLIALVFAVGADMSAFFQVIELVLPDQPGWIALLLVCGFTAIVLTLAHFAGTTLRDRKAKVPWIPGAAAIPFILAWLAMGLLAAWVRWKFGTTPAHGGGFLLDGPAGEGISRDTAPLPAALFLALYTGSGLVTGFWAYLSHNPRQRAYRKAEKAHQLAAVRAGVSDLAHANQITRWQAQLDAREAARTVLHAERANRRAFAAELKEDVRRLIASKIGDPAVTDAILAGDARPYDFRPLYPHRDDEDRPDRESA